MKTLITLVTILSMLGAPSGAFAEAQTATSEVEGPRLVVRGLAQGSAITVHLTNGTRIEGRFAGESNDDLLVTIAGSRAGTGLRRIRWSQVASVEHSTQVASSEDGRRYDDTGLGAPDATRVRLVATALGVGKTVDVKTTTSKKLRAKIQSIDESGFTVAHGRTPVRLTIAYDEVTQLKAAGWPAGAKIALAAGAVVGGSILIWLVNILSCQCG